MMDYYELMCFREAAQSLESRWREEEGREQRYHKVDLFRSFPYPCIGGGGGATKLVGTELLIYLSGGPTKSGFVVCIIDYETEK